jgi:hypothetical protein
MARDRVRQIDKLDRRLEWTMSLSSVDDCRSNVRSDAHFVGISHKQIDELQLRVVVHNRTGGFGSFVRLIVPHVERTVDKVRETSAGIVDLRRAKATIEQDAVKSSSRAVAVESTLCKHNLQIGKRRRVKLDPLAEPSLQLECRRSLECGRISVDANNRRAWKRRQQCRRMTTISEPVITVTIESRGKPQYLRCIDEQWICHFGSYFRYRR